LQLIGSGTFDLSQLANFTGFQSIKLDNPTTGFASLILNNQPVEVDATGPVGISVGSLSNWNSSDIVNGDASQSYSQDYIYFFNSQNQQPLTYDLTNNSFSHVGIDGGSANLTLLINNADTAGIQYFNGFATNDELMTASSTLDLSHTTVSGFRVASTNSLGTTFTVGDLGTAFQIAGGPGHDTIQTSALTFTADQRNAIFATSSIETIIDPSGTYNASSTTEPPTPAAPSDNAVVNGYVNAAHDTAAQTLTGNAEDGSTVTLYDNSTQIGTTIANATTGAWSLPIGQLADRSTHSYTVTATDAAGNVSQPSAALNFTVDITPPATPVAPADSAVVNGYVNAARDTAGQVLTGSAEDGSTVTVYDNSTQIGTTTANDLTGSWSFPIGQLANGSTYSYTVTATDAAGNVSQPSTALYLVVDTTAPTTPGAPADSAVVNGYVNAARDTAAQVLTGNAEKGDTVTIYDNDTQIGTTRANASTGNWGFLIGQLADGSTHSYTITATDAAGNVSQPSAALSFVVDTTAPVTPAAPSDSAVINGYVNATHDSAAQALTGSAEKGSTVTIYDKGTKVGTTTANGSTGAWSLPIGQLADGSTHSYTVTATDAAGNVSQPSTALSFAVDTTVPVTLAAPADSAVIDGYVNAAHDTAKSAAVRLRAGITLAPPARHTACPSRSARPP
jgi:hypothetical protein